MQICNTFTHSLTPSSQLHKTVSMPVFQDQTSFSHEYVESVEEGYWRNCTKWIMRLRKKINISKSSLYLAVSYLGRLLKLGFTLNEDNYQKVAACLVLISAKMNEIYPPKMSSLLNRCGKSVSKHQLTLVESWILQYFNFDMSFSEISFSYMVKILGEGNEDKLQDCQKLLGLAITELQIMKMGEEIIALGIIYLIKPSLVREWRIYSLHKVKTAASKIYNLYIANKGTTKN